MGKTAKITITFEIPLDVKLADGQVLHRDLKTVFRTLTQGISQTQQAFIKAIEAKEV